MTAEQIKAVQVELQVVADRYGITRWAFCGENKKRIFVGFMGEPKMTQGAAMMTVLNVGRLWQYARQSCRELLNSYERLP